MMKEESKVDMYGDAHYEDTPAYQVLKKHNLLDTRYRLTSSADLDAVGANSSRSKNFLLNLFCCPMKCLFHTFQVDAGKLRLVEDGRGGYSFRKEGVHLICDPFHSVKSEQKAFNTGVIRHGDRTIVVVEQGKIGFAHDQGQPVLLPPGLHQWKSSTLVFEKTYDLNNNVIRMGPLTLVTVDEGYSAITEDNGRQQILEGGDCYLLTHRNWKFQKYVSTKVQSSTMDRIEATSADNVLMAVDASVIWRISDVATAARNSAETIAKDGHDMDTDNDVSNINKLRNDVLKQSEASLAAFVGAVQYSDTFGVAAAAQDGEAALAPACVTAEVEVLGGGRGAPDVKDAATAYSSPLFDKARLATCVENANKVTATYGVTIISINIVAAVPADKSLMVALAQGAVAAAEAQKFETVARGRAEANKIEAQGEAEAQVMRANGEAQAEIVRAEGARTAAEKIGASDTAVRFALIDKTGAALSNNKAFFFGAEAGDIGKVLMPAALDVAAKGVAASPISVI